MKAWRGAERVPAHVVHRERLATLSIACQWLGNCCQELPDQRDGLAPLQLVRQRGGKALDDVLRRLRCPVHKTDNAPRRLQGLSQKRGITG